VSEQEVTNYIHQIKEGPRMNFAYMSLAFPPQYFFFYVLPRVFVGKTLDQIQRVMILIPGQIISWHIKSFTMLGDRTLGI